MTPGTNEKHYLAGALHLATGKMLYCLGPRKNNGLFRALLTLLDTAYPASAVTRIYVVVDNYCIEAVEEFCPLCCRPFRARACQINQYEAS